MYIADLNCAVGLANGEEASVGGLHGTPEYAAPEVMLLLLLLLLWSSDLVHTDAHLVDVDDWGQSAAASLQRDGVTRRGVAVAVPSSVSSPVRRSGVGVISRAEIGVNLPRGECDGVGVRRWCCGIGMSARRRDSPSLRRCTARCQTRGRSACVCM